LALAFHSNGKTRGYKNNRVIDISASQVGKRKLRLTMR
jgi:hypothetical protein